MTKSRSELLGVLLGHLLGCWCGLWAIHALTPLGWWGSATVFYGASYFITQHQK